MADKFINELDPASGISLADLLAIEQGVGGTPETLYLTITTFLDKMSQGRYVITPSVASGNLTVAIKDMSGNNAASDNVISFRVGNTLYNLAAAASVVKNAATNWCNLGSAELNGLSHDLFMYAIGETGASAGLKFGFSRIPYALTMADFVNTTTSEKYIAGNWTNYTATDAVNNIGRFRASLSSGAGYTWSIPTPVVVNAPIHASDWLTWQPAFSADAGTYNTVTTNWARYSIDQKAVRAIVKATGTTSSTPIILRCTLPFEAAVAAGAAGFVFDSALFGGLIQIAAGSPDTLEFSKYNAAAFAAGATKVIDGEVFYIIE